MIHIPENKRNVPSLFTCLDGTEVKTAEDWTGKRRPEILGILRKEEYGCLPDMGDVQINIRVAAVRQGGNCLLYTSPSPPDMRRSRIPSYA